MRAIVSKKSAKAEAKSKVTKKRLPMKKTVATKVAPKNAGLLNSLLVEKALQAMHADEKENKNKGGELFGNEQAVFMQVLIAKVPSGPNVHLCVPVKHSVLSADSDILLVTPDLKGEDVNDFEKNVEHYRSLLNKHGITCIKDIMPYTQLRKQYMDFEMQNKLARLYDLFICDGAIISYMQKTFGHIIGKQRKPFAPINMEASNLVACLHKILHQTNITIHSKGNCYSVKVGNTSLQEKKLVENILDVSDYLGKKIPGGFQNIKGLLVKKAQGKSVQLYLSTVHAQKVKLQSVKDDKQKNGTAVGELSTRNDVIVVVKPSGDVVAKKDGVIDNKVSKKVQVSVKSKNGKSTKKTFPQKQKTLRKTTFKKKQSKLVVKKSVK